jgi:hypothetical protein
MPGFVLPLVQEKVTQEMNSELVKDFLEKEIAGALFQMGPWKAPEPDGFPVRFYQRHWEVMNVDVVAATRRFFQDGIMSDGINGTAIMLIPKSNEPEELKDFRPISLCNVIYKLISKCIVNRLRGILDDLIYPEQSAFVPTRRITDNALLAFECAHAIQRQSGRRVYSCAYKQDLSKAYDRVDWGFLKWVMEKLSFHNNFIQWIMTCVTIVCHSVHFSGTELCPFRPWWVFDKVIRSRHICFY